MKKLILVTIAVFFAACTPAVGEPVAFAKACDKANDNKMIEVQGFLVPDGMMTCSNYGGRMDCGFRLKDKADSEEKGFSADVAVGSGANSMDQVESGFKPEDLVVRDKDGNRIDLNNKLKVTGEQNVSNDPVSKDLVCYMKVYKIEQEN